MAMTVRERSEAQWQKWTSNFLTEVFNGPFQLQDDETLKPAKKFVFLMPTCVELMLTTSGGISPCNSNTHFYPRLVPQDTRVKLYCDFPEDNRIEEIRKLLKCKMIENINNIIIEYIGQDREFPYYTQAEKEARFAVRLNCPPHLIPPWN